MASRFEAELAQRQGKSKFEAELESRNEGFNPISAIGDVVSGAVEGVSEAVRGKQDPAFEGVGGFSTEGIRDPETAAQVNRAKVLGVSDEVFGDLVKQALGPRLKKVEADKFGQEVITYTDDFGKERREFINAPGLDVQDVDRAINSTLPFLVAGGAVGKLAKGAPLAGRAAAQAVGQVGASVGQDVAAGADIDPTKAGVAAAGGAVGETFLPAVRGVVSLFKRNRGLVDASTGQLTNQGRAAITRAGLNEKDLTPEFMDLLSNPEVARSSDDIQSIMRAQSDQFGIRSSQGQRSLDPNALSIEEQSRRGLLGQSAKDVATDFDAGQRADVVRAVGEQGERLGADAVENAGDAGERLSTGLAKQGDKADQQITKAFNAVDVKNIFPKGIPKKNLDKLGEFVRKELGTLQQRLSDRGTPAANEALRFLDDFTKGKARQPKIDILKKGAPPKSNFETVRRDLNDFVADAKTNTDLKAATAVKTAYNKWVKDLAQGALESANPEEFAKLQSAITLTSKLKKLFEVQGVNDAGGKIIKKIMEGVDSPEGAVSALLTAGFKSPPKNGAVNAAQRMKTILRKEQPEAWHAIRQAYWLKLTRGQNLFKDGPITRQEMDTALGQISRNVEDALRNQGSLVKALFSPEEVTQIRNFGRAARRSQSANPNPSGTAFEAQRMNKAATDNVLTNLLRRQAAGQQIRGNAVKATFWRVMTKRAISIFGARGEGIAARGAARTFSRDLPTRRTTGGGGLGGAAAVQLEDQQ